MKVKSKLIDSVDDCLKDTKRGCLYILKNELGVAVVLCTADKDSSSHLFSGVVIYSTHNSHKIGSTSDSWKKSVFTSFYGTIEIASEK